MGVWREPRAPGPRDCADPGGRWWGWTWVALRDLEGELAKLLVDMERTALLVTLSSCREGAASNHDGEGGGRVSWETGAMKRERGL